MSLRFRSFSFLLLLALLLLPRGANAQVVLGQPCPSTSYGTTTMTTDGLNIAACLKVKNTTNQYIWKNMTYSCKTYSGKGPCQCPFGAGSYYTYCKTSTGGAGPKARNCSGDCHNDGEPLAMGSKAWCSQMQSAGWFISWQFTECD